MSYNKSKRSAHLARYKHAMDTEPYVRVLIHPKSVAPHSLRVAFVHVPVHSDPNPDTFRQKDGSSRPLIVIVTLGTIRNLVPSFLVADHSTENFSNSHLNHKMGDPLTPLDRRVTEGLFGLSLPPRALGSGAS